MNIKPNVSMTDKSIRFILAAVIAALYFSGVISGVIGVVLLIGAGVLVVTGFMRFCPLYYLLGICTYKPKASS